MNFSPSESNFYARGDKCQYEFVEQSTNARLIVPVLFSIFLLSPFMEDISHYIDSLNYPPPTLVHHLSHHLSSCPINFLLQLF